MGVETAIRSDLPNVQGSKKRVRMIQANSPSKTNPLFSPSAAPMTKRHGPKPTRRGAVRLPTALGCPFDHGSSSTFDIVNLALRTAAQEICEDDACDQVVTKRVGFNLHLNRIIAAETTPLSEGEIVDCWWTSQEYKAAAEQSCNEAVSLIENCDASVQLLLNIISYCNQSSCDQPDDRNNFALSLSQSGLSRGRESDAVPVIKKLRNKHRDAVLQYVNRIPKHLKPDLRERMLSARSIQFSRPHKILARLLGEADALSVQSQNLQ